MALKVIFTTLKKKRVLCLKTGSYFLTVQLNIIINLIIIYIQSNQVVQLAEHNKQ